MFKPIDITRIRESIENAHELQEQIGVFRILNTPENALDGPDSFRSANYDAAYYCLHKYTKRLQIVVKSKFFNRLYVEIPRQEGELINIFAIEVWKAKRNSKSDIGINEQKLIPIPVFEKDQSDSNKTILFFHRNIVLYKETPENIIQTFFITLHSTGGNLLNVQKKKTWTGSLDSVPITIEEREKGLYPLQFPSFEEKITSKVLNHVGRLLYHKLTYYFIWPFTDYQKSTFLKDCVLKHNLPDYFFGYDLVYVFNSTTNEISCEFDLFLFDKYEANNYNAFKEKGLILRIPPTNVEEIQLPFLELQQRIKIENFDFSGVQTRYLSYKFFESTNGITPERSVVYIDNKMSISSFRTYDDANQDLKNYAKRVLTDLQINAKKTDSDYQFNNDFNDLDECKILIEAAGYKLFTLILPFYSYEFSTPLLNDSFLSFATKLYKQWEDRESYILECLSEEPNNWDDDIYEYYQAFEIDASDFIDVDYDFRDYDKEEYSNQGYINKPDSLVVKIAL